MAQLAAGWRVRAQPDCHKCVAADSEDQLQAASQQGFQHGVPRASEAEPWHELPHQGEASTTMLLPSPSAEWPVRSRMERVISRDSTHAAVPCCGSFECKAQSTEQPRKDAISTSCVTQYSQHSHGQSCCTYDAAHPAGSKLSLQLPPTWLAPVQVTFQPLQQAFCSDVIEFTCSNGSFWVRVTACLPAVGLQVRLLASAEPAMHNMLS